MITDIHELIAQLKLRLPDYLALHGVSEPNKKFLCLFPGHTDQNPSMQMHKCGTFVNCFSGGHHGDIFTVANWLEDKPLDGEDFIKDNVYYLADLLGIKYSICSTNSEKIALKNNYLRAYKTVASYIEFTADKTPTPAFEKEMVKRGWAVKKSIGLGLGCVHSFKDVLNLLKANDFTNEFIDLCGLMRADLFNPDNVLFTIYDAYGRPIAFYARDTKFEEKKKAYEARDKMDMSHSKVPMKFNSTANFTGIYEKSLNPYGIHDIKNSHTVIVVEGHGCKHSLRLAEIDNVIALGGLAFNEQLVSKLSSLGVTKLVLTLDNDDKGKEKLKSIIRQYYGKLPLDLSVLDMASVYNDVKDPDEFLRKYNVEAFKQIPEKNALEWIAITELFEKGDAYVVLQDLLPLIALERSPINRRRIEGLISDITGIDKNDIHDEVEQKITLSKDRKGEVALKILDEARELLISNPSAIDAVTNLISSRLGNINKTDTDEDLYSSNEVLRSLALQEEREDSGVIDPIIRTGWEEFDSKIQLPQEEAFCLIPGAPNTGKSSLCLCAANGILDNDPDAIVIIHSTDDSRAVYFNRLVANKAKINMNWIKRPNHYLDETLARRRKDAYKELTEHIRSGRLIIKDVMHGDTVEYHGKLVQYIRDKNPSKKIFSVCDNFHRLGTEIGYDDSRVKYKYTSGLMKSYTTKYGIVEFCTVEMNKMRMYERHTTAETIAEAASLQFDANLIIFLYNEINALRENAKMVFPSTTMDYHPVAGYLHKPTTKPLIEALVLKNKVSEFKGSLWFKFHPELANYDPISYEEVKQITADGEEQG
jgi:DNA primase